jgi:hypothetical protein
MEGGTASKLFRQAILNGGLNKGGGVCGILAVTGDTRAFLRLFKSSIDQEAKKAQEQIGSRDHEVNVGIVGLGLTQRVIILRTGGGDGFLSGGAGRDWPWQCQNQEASEKSQKC